MSADPEVQAAAIARRERIMAVASAGLAEQFRDMSRGIRPVRFIRTGAGPAVPVAVPRRPRVTRGLAAVVEFESALAEFGDLCGSVTDDAEEREQLAAATRDAVASFTESVERATADLYASAFAAGGVVRGVLEALVGRLGPESTIADCDAVWNCAFSLGGFAFLRMTGAHDVLLGHAQSLIENGLLNLFPNSATAVYIRKYFLTEIVQRAHAAEGAAEPSSAMGRRTVVGDITEHYPATRRPRRDDA